MKWFIKPHKSRRAKGLSDQHNDKSWHLKPTNDDKKPKRHQVASSYTFPKHPAMMIISPNAAITIKAMFAASQPIKRASNTVNPLIFVGILFVFENGASVQKADYKVENDLAYEAELDAFFQGVVNILKTAEKGYEKYVYNSPKNRANEHGPN